MTGFVVQGHIFSELQQKTLYKVSWTMTEQ